MPKYPKVEQGVIDDDTYKSLKEDRGIEVLRIQRTKTFENLQGLEYQLLAKHTWSKTDRLFHLSRKYYGTIEFWWVIGLVNGKPTDAHYSVGDVIKIPRKPSVISEAIR